MNKQFKKIQQLSKEATLLSSVQALLEWDQETMMPKEGIQLRTQQLEMIAPLLHKKRTEGRFAKSLSALIDLETGKILDESLEHKYKACLREWRRDYLKSTKLPSSFVKAFAKTTSAAIDNWAKAKERNDFSFFAPHLEKIVALCRKKADYLGYQEHPYDALLDIYEPGSKVSDISPLFERLNKKLTPLLDKVTSKPRPENEFLFGTFEGSKQLEFGWQILTQAFGFSKSNCRLDLSAHPFCHGVYPKETRMTTKIHKNSLLSSLFGVIHEGGHGLYNFNLPEEHFGTPLCEAISLGIDESQSRFWEAYIGHSYPFWTLFFSKLQALFPEKLGRVTLDQFYKAINTVTRSLIRIEADEVTYSFHIALRYEMEKGLIEGSIKVKDVPDLWNAKMEHYLKIKPQSAAEGCLQDIHWSMGGFGYFPTYTLGNLYGAAFFMQFVKENGEWEKRVSSGEFQFISEWLKENIHKYGREYLPQELLKKVTGKTLTEDDFINYLERKYL